ncbi:MAG: DNA gyrase inhibitor YacG [Planktomarina sp.]
MACPQCGDETVEKYRPFCSKRCADVDLGKWFDGTYTMASDEEADVDKDSDEGFLN